MNDVDDVVAALAAGGVVALATDTVYGLACDPGNAAAVERIYAIKGRPPGLDLTVLAASIDDLDEDVVFTEAARRLAAAHWPGALSIVLRLRRRRWVIPRAGETLNTRVPGHPGLLALLGRTGPLATTSANRHGEPAASTAAEVRRVLGSELDAVFDGGPAHGRASTIIDCTSTPPRVLREGPIGADALRSLLGGLTSRSTEG